MVTSTTSASPTTTVSLQPVTSATSTGCTSIVFSQPVTSTASTSSTSTASLHMVTSTTSTSPTTTVFSQPVTSTASTSSTSTASLHMVTSTTSSSPTTTVLLQPVTSTTSSSTSTVSLQPVNSTTSTGCTSTAPLHMVTSTTSTSPTTTAPLHMVTSTTSTSPTTTVILQPVPSTTSTSSTSTVSSQPVTSTASSSTSTASLHMITSTKSSPTTTVLLQPVPSTTSTSSTSTAPLHMVTSTTSTSPTTTVSLQPVTSTTFTSSTSTVPLHMVTSTTSSSPTTTVLLQPVTSVTSTSSTSTVSLKPVTSTTSSSSTSTASLHMVTSTTSTSPTTTVPLPPITSTAFTGHTSTGLNITPLEECRTTGRCVDLLDNIENMTAEVLPLTNVTSILNVVLNASDMFLESSSADPNKLVSYGNRMLKASEKLVSMLVKPTNTSDYVTFTLDTLEVEIFMVGPQVTLEKIPRLNTTNSSVDIDLIGIAKNNNETRSAAVAFMSYNMMEKLLKPDFFNTPKDTIKTMMSTVISATLPKTTNTKLTKPVNFTLKHIREFDPSGSVSCVYWNIREWIVDGCSVLETNSNYTVCSCDHLSTFALIMQTSHPPENDPLLELLNLVCVIVGLVFFSLALLTFVLCQWSPGVNNVARINICISLLLAHLLFLLTQQFLSFIRPQQVLCAVISGLLQFFFLSGFVWMLIEAVLLFICVKNLSQISSINREVLSSGFLCVIGYLVALVVVAVSAVVDPKGYGSEKCWIKIDKGFISRFLGPVCMILT
uniref:Mucin-5AC-like n=1 Tax=Sinocyclocheilus rhinocerous TaxID=307959 RepID=A0A673GFT6_9TELE